ncbi:hypothetical protein EYZ11_005158 [Aspergillus tanneri]|uniref:Stress-response A/B barrel domain-containing protein n=1 Tax=Aspergillus tanneri TaxID=1220188 RepID=A0A4V6RQU8_9EURO|nr:uncharacterized protein ATNIH1004_007189 [Aspergillus tanneri]KAA8645770.1 hypothetical protein ATNIH1004_007189 [Aspergillus tanneri]THC95344.1 hypothetical protein EYZ11_005158 [Aspergillus tanneri]
MPPITHIVLFRFKPDTSRDDINDACDRMLNLKNTCLHPVSNKPYIRSSSGGVDNSKEGIQHGMTHAFVVEFDSVEDRDYYVEKDSTHHAFIKSLDGVIEKAQAVDFTAGVF